MPVKMRIELIEAIDGGWIASCPDIAGATATGASQELACKRLYASILRSIADATMRGDSRHHLIEFTD